MKAIATVIIAIVQFWLLVAISIIAAILEVKDLTGRGGK